MKKLSIDDLSIKQMKMFLTVANHRSFSEAANSLFVNQSVISRTIQGMENALNVVLFYRRSNGIELTNQGREVYRHLKAFVTDYESLIARIHSKEEVTDDTIVAGVLNLDDTVELTRNLIHIYQKHNPDAHFSIHTFAMRELHDSLMCDDMHCGFSFRLGIGTMPNVTAEHVVTLESYFCINSKNKGIKDNSFNPVSLADETLILTSVIDFKNPEERALGVCRKYGFQPGSIRYVSTRIEAQIAVRNAEGFTIDGKSFRDRYPDDIVVFPITGLKLEQGMVALHKEKMTHRPTMEFLQWIRDQRFKESDLR